MTVRADRDGAGIGAGRSGPDEIDPVAPTRDKFLQAGIQTAARSRPAPSGASFRPLMFVSHSLDDFSE